MTAAARLARPVDDDQVAPRTVLLGPVPCSTCGAWVEWAGAGWLALTSDEPHDCAPYLAGRRRTRSRGWTPAYTPQPYQPSPVLARVAVALAGVFAVLVVAAWASGTL